MTRRRVTVDCPACGHRKRAPMIFRPYCSGRCWEARAAATVAGEPDATGDRQEESRDR
jgi:endogenous inhibitor of DNA gyrase (YacG/DUF329 family)